MDLWQRRIAQIPILIDVPHAGTHVPEDLLERFTPGAQALPDTDWHVDKLVAFSQKLGVGLLAATHSRYVVDLNRDPDGALLYPGIDNTELVPLSRFDNGPIYRHGQTPSAAEIAQRIETYWRPYHDRLKADIEEILEHFGQCLLLDCHSIPANVPRFFEGRLPDLNLGTADRKSASRTLIDEAWSVLESQDRFTRVQDGRFKGGYVTRHYGQPSRQVHALQIEIVQNCYMEEEAPHRFDAGRAASLIGVLENLVGALSRRLSL
nr:N-formylglutamate amidohydrolase [uncultured bacterium]